jgi:hypothetical protein
VWIESQLFNQVKSNLTLDAASTFCYQYSHSCGLTFPDFYMSVNSAVTSVVNSAAKQKKHAPESFKIKSAHLQAVALMIKTADWSALAF